MSPVFYSNLKYNYYVVLLDSLVREVKRQSIASRVQAEKADIVEEYNNRFYLPIWYWLNIASRGIWHINYVELIVSKQVCQFVIAMKRHGSASLQLSSPNTTLSSSGRGGDSNDPHGSEFQTQDVTKSGALLSEKELQQIEKSYVQGITASEVVDIFISRGIRFSEATFRKYVQQGLLPRSRRVGRKGKYRGSLGMYPVKAVRRVNNIKELMLERYTIEEIKQRFFASYRECGDISGKY